MVGIEPGLTLLLDVPVAIGLSARARRGGGRTASSASSDDFFERVREGFLRAAAADPQRVSA